MRRVQSIFSGKANTHASWGGLRWIKPAGYAPHLRARKWMGEVIVSYEVGKGSKMALDHGGYLWADDAYSGDDRGERAE